MNAKQRKAAAAAAKLAEAGIAAAAKIEEEAAAAAAAAKIEEEAAAKNDAPESNPLGDKVPENLPEAPAVTKAAKKEKGITFVSLLDVILKKGGSWEEMIAAGTAAKKELEALHPEIPVEFNGKAKLKSLVAYRVVNQKLADYLGGKAVTEKGIF